MLTSTLGQCFRRISGNRISNGRPNSHLTLAILTLFAGATAAFGQSYYGALRGNVVDPNGGAIATAKITLINEGTSEQRAAVTSNAGEFVYSEVVPATYSVWVESPGFKKFERHGIIVGTQQQVSLDLKMEVGQVSESVQVTESAPLIESATASQGQVLDNQKLSDLPNLGRNPFMLSKLAANVIPVGNPAYNRMEDQSGSSSISIAGGPVRGNNYLIDGVPITDAANRAIIIPTLEAVQEVKVQANTYDAEMARTGGGMFNTLMKSGANEYHGSLYGHLRRTAWDANSFFNNAAGVPITNQPNDTWGASFGGKVWIPKLYDGKNKTFFYLGYEHYDDIQSASSTFAAPTAAEKQGDFSAAGLPVIYNPLSGSTRTPFVNNVIPVSMQNPVGMALASNFQAPQTAPKFYGDQDITGSASLPCRAAQYTGKLDEDFTQWWRASLSYLRYFSLEPGNTWFTSLSTPDGWRLLRRVDTTQFNNLITVNPTTVVTVRYGFNRFPNYTYDVSQNYNLAGLGFSPSFVSQIPTAKSQFPPILMTNLYSLGVQDNNSFVDLASNNFGASVAKYMGRHSLKVGFDYRKIKAAGNDFNDAAGNYSFNGIFTASNGTGKGTGGADLADLLLGYPSSGNIYTSTKLSEFSNYYGAYVQDDFRFNSKLTINMGLRWEHESGLQEQNNGIVVNFDGTATNPLAANVTGISPKGEIVYAGGNKTAAGNPYSSKWGPRVGLAYTLNSKTVVRAGYGIFFAPQYALGSPIATVGYNQTTTYIASTDGNTTPDHTLTNPFPTGIIQPVGNTLGALTGIGQSFTLVDPHAKSPYVEQFSLDVQRELPFGIAGEVGFVGSKSSHLSLGATSLNGNALNPSYLSMGATALAAPVANPFYGHGGVGVIGTATVQESQLLLPYPTYGTISYQFNDNNKALYDSMVMKLQKRMSNGMTLLSSLTWSRNWDESGGGVGNTLNSGSKGPQNPYNLAAEYAFSNIDSPWRWSSSVSYQLPFGTGKKWLTSGKALNYVVGGWSANAVSIFQTGFPLQISQSTNNNSAFGYASQRPNATGVSPVTTGSLEDRLADYINPAAFSTAAKGTFGNVGRTIDMRGPGQVNWDMSVFKDVLVREKLKAQFRCEALNAMNTPLFYGPSTSFGSSSFGKITSQANFSRQLQLAMRFSF
jgi:hypothetical protein